MNIMMIFPAFDRVFSSLDFEEEIEIEEIEQFLKQYHPQPFLFCANEIQVTIHMPFPVKDKFYNFEGNELDFLFPAPC